MNALAQQSMAAASTIEWDAACVRQIRAAAADEAAIEVFSAAERAFTEEVAAMPPPPPNRFLPGETTAEGYNARNAVHRERERQHIVEIRARHRVDEYEAVYDAASEELTASVAALLATPAPDLAAVAHKIEIAQLCNLGAWSMAPLLDDLRRLAA